MILLRSDLRFSYDAAGSVVAVDYSTDGGSTFTTYYYLRNAQNDIVKLIDSSGTTVVEYIYDSWGKLLSVTGTLANTVGADQPFRYRGYVYDEETEWYYLRSRYYDPNTGRFISADVLLSTGQGVIGHNSFAYCNNNPIIMIDSEGTFPFIALIALACVVIAACTVMNGCSNPPMSDVGAAQPFVELSGSNDPKSPNCYAFAIGSPENEQPGKTSGRYPTRWNDVYDVGKSVEADLKAKGYTVRQISGPDAKVYENEFKIALRVGTRPIMTPDGRFFYDYHFMRQTDDGRWAEKHGIGEPSICHGFGETPDTIPWTLGGKPYYDSAIIYYAVGR